MGLIGWNYHSVMIGDAANILIKMMNSAINDPATHLAIFVLLPDSSARVDFIQVSTGGPDLPMLRPLTALHACGVSVVI